MKVEMMNLKDQITFEQNPGFNNQNEFKIEVFNSTPDLYDSRVKKIAYE